MGCPSVGVGFPDRVAACPRRPQKNPIVSQSVVVPSFVGRRARGGDIQPGRGLEVRIGKDEGEWVSSEDRSEVVKGREEAERADPSTTQLGVGFSGGKSDRLGRGGSCRFSGTERDGRAGKDVLASPLLERDSSRSGLSDRCEGGEDEEGGSQQGESHRVRVGGGVDWGDGGLRVRWDSWVRSSFCTLSEGRKRKVGRA